MKPLFVGLLAAAVIAAIPVHAAEVKILASPNMRPLLTDMTPEIEKSGHTLTVTYDSAGAVKTRAAAGEDTDVVMTLRPLLDELAGQGKAKNVVTVGRSFIAVVVPSGKPKPDISSPAAFKRSLQSAKSIVYSDPSKGGLSGVFTARMIEKMGIADEMKAKTKLVPPGGVALVDEIGKKEVDFGIDQLTVVAASRASKW